MILIPPPQCDGGIFLLVKAINRLIPLDKRGFFVYN